MLLKLLPYYYATKNILGVDLEYRFDFFLRSVKYILSIGGMALVWMAVNQANPNSSINNTDIVTYFLLALLLYGFSNFHTAAIETDILYGDLSKFLSKPVSFLQFHFFTLGGEQVLDFLIKLIICIPLFFWINFQLPPLPNIILFLLYLPLIFFFSFCTYAACSLLSFWISNSDSVRMTVLFLARTFSGVLIPYAFFPEQVRTFLMYTPFPYLVAQPIALMQNQISIAAGIEGLGVLSIWSIISLLIMWLLWKRGVDIYEGAGI